MEPRLKNLPAIVHEPYRALQQVEATLHDQSDLDHGIQELVRLRVSQINGCGFCVDMHAHDAKAAGETDERLISVAAWREAPWYTDAERAALGLAESATRLADRGDAVPDDVWDAATAQFEDKALATLVATIAMINAWNRLSVTTRQVAGSHRTAAARTRTQHLT